MSITRLGATKKYADNWEEIFGGRTNRSIAKTGAASVKKPAASAGKKKSAKKKAAKKPPRRLTAKKTRKTK